MKKGKTVLLCFMITTVLVIIFSSLVNGCQNDNKTKSNVSSSDNHLPLILCVEREESQFNPFEIPMPVYTQQFIYEKCLNEDWSFEYILALIAIESKFDKNADNGIDKGYMQINQRNFNWLRKAIKVDNFNPFDAEHNINAGMYYLNYLRNHWRTQGFSEEDVFFLTTLSYHKGIKGAKRHVKNHGYNSSYVDEVFEYKTRLEKREINVL